MKGLVIVWLASLWVKAPEPLSPMVSFRVCRVKAPVRLRVTALPAVVAFRVRELKVWVPPEALS